MKILLVQTGFLGDVVLSTPCLPLIRERFPDAEIDLLVIPRAAAIVRSHPLVRKVLTYDKRGKQSGLRGLWQLAKELRQENYQLAISLHKSYRTAALLWLAGIPQRVGFAEAAATFLYTNTAPRRDLKHEVLRNAAIMRAFGVEPQADELELQIYLPENTRQKAQELLQGLHRPIVGVAPGSVWLTKRWTEHGFAELVKLLVESNASVVLLGGPEDRLLGEQIIEKAKLIGSAPVRTLIGQTDLVESAAVIAQCDAMITNDSSPLHLAAATKTPLVAIFCATVPEFGFGPWAGGQERRGAEQLILEVENLACRPCGRHGGNTCPTGTHACREGIPAQRVFNATMSLLKQPRKLVEEVLTK